MANTVDKVINIATNEVGYLEKKTNSSLDSKTANAGSNNYTKYWRDMKPSFQGQPWCDCFVDWCFVQAYGKEEAQKLECGGCGEYYTPTSAQRYKDKKQWYTSSPKKGDQIFFKNSTRIYHTGLVYKVDSTYVYTIEGNTSTGSGVVANGGGVCKKKYALSNSKIAGYGRPKYDTETTSATTTSNNTTTSTTNTTTSTASSSALIKKGQEAAISFINKTAIGSTKFSATGVRDAQTKLLAAAVLQTAMNKDYKSGLEVDGEIGPKSKTALGSHYVEVGETQYMVTAAEILLYLKGKDPKGIEYPGTYGSGLKAAAGTSKITAATFLSYLN